MGTRDSVLIYRIGSLGDTVVTLPCFHLIARTFPNSRRVLLTNSPVHAKAPAASAVLGESGLVHDYLSYPVGSRNFFQLASLWWKIRRLKVGTVINLSPVRGEAANRRDALFFRLCGAKTIVGTPTGELANYHYDVQNDRYEAEASRLARSLAALGDAHLENRASWDLLLTQSEKSRAEAALRFVHDKPFLTLGIASKQQVTDWGVSNWKQLMPLLRPKFPDHVLVFIGAKEDRPAVDEVSAEWPGESLNLCGELLPRESAAVIQKADAYIGLDSGPIHVAASVGTICVSVSAANKLPGMWFPFGDKHEVIYHKTECFGCNLQTCTIEKNRCILSITPEEVVAATVRAVGRKTPEPVPAVPRSR
jgi:heptosyltransferase III